MARGPQVDVAAYRKILVARKRGLTDTETAKKLGVSRQLVHMKVWLMRKAGIVVPPSITKRRRGAPEVLRAMAKKLGLTVRNGRVKAA